MKLLLENWREYLKLESFEGGIDPDQGKAIEETGLILNRYLGEGKHGKVYEVENKKTGQRMAAKVISTLNSQIYSETKNYNWIIKNRDKLPDDVKQHLVEVYELIETPDRKYLIILMEQLSPAPRNVIDQIFAHDKESKYSEEKEKRIFKDPEATYKIINDVLEKNQILKTEYWNHRFPSEMREAAAKTILKTFFLNKRVPKSTVPNVYTVGALSTYEKDAEGSDLYSLEWKNLFNAILNEIEEIIVEARVRKAMKAIKEPSAEEEDRLTEEARMYLHGDGKSVFWHLAAGLESDLHYYINKHIIPVKYGAGYVDPQAGAGPEIAAVFPEIEGILKTIKYFAEHGWRARDLHAGNIMTRSDTNQLVIVDVGLFVVERDFR